ncbi:hypothetical protein [Corynebacterium pacaense]|uniref:hypothetical protein n=1 Tax=Corynebacterium pacaense TaxID=1816684 RepID=UPI0009B94693|nr:hypothetical protein [Corynebacterium pacaense]
MTGPYDSNYPGSNDPYGQQYPGGPTGGYPGGFDNGYNGYNGGPYGMSQPGYGAGQFSPDAPQPTLAEAANNQIDIGDSFTQAWRGFIATWVPWVLSALLFFAAAVIVSLVVLIPLLAAALADPDGSGGVSVGIFAGVGVIGFIAMLVLAVYAVVWQLNCWRNALRVVRGESITFGDFFRLNGLGWPIVAELVVTALCYVGLLLFVVPGLIIAFILMFVVPAMFILRDASIGNSFSLSWRVVSTQFGAAVLIFLVTWLLNFVGGLVVIGALVTTPLMYLMITHALQRAIGGPLVQRA